MSSEEPFIREIIQAPDDDAPRLIYADWLEEHGNVDRAEFIRVQCDLATLSPSLPSSHPQYAASKRLEQELLNTFGRQWAEPLGGGVAEWEYRRGFVERVRLNGDCTQQELEAAFAVAPIQHLRHTDSGSESFPRQTLLASPQTMLRIRGLELENIDRLPETLLRSRYMKNLRSLNLDFEHSWTQSSKDEIDRSLSEVLGRPVLAKLQTLSLNSSAAATLETIARSPVLRQLRRLFLFDLWHPDEVSPTLIREFGRSLNVANLEELAIVNARFSADVWLEFTKWPILRKLKKLYLPKSLCSDRQAEEYPWGQPVYLRQEAEFAAPLDSSTDVDWDSNLSCRDVTSSTGFQSKHMNNMEHVYAMWTYVRQGQFDALEERYRRDCRESAGSETENAIASVDFLPYQEAIRESLIRISKLAQAEQAQIRKLRPQEIRCMLFTFRTDRLWSGRMEIAPLRVDEPFQPLTIDRYTRAFVGEEGPSFEAAGHVAMRNLEQDPGAALNYMIARTFAAAGRAAKQVGKLPLPFFVNAATRVLLQIC